MLGLFYFGVTDYYNLAEVGVEIISTVLHRDYRAAASMFYNRDRFSAIATEREKK